MRHKKEFNNKKLKQVWWTDFRTCHRTTFWLLWRRMALGSCKSSVKCQSQSLSYEFYWTRLRATFICDAGRLVTCWSETGREGGAQNVRKLLSWPPWIIHVPAHLAAPDSRQGSGHSVQMFRTRQLHQSLSCSSKWHCHFVFSILHCFSDDLMV